MLLTPLIQRGNEPQGGTCVKPPYGQYLEQKLGGGILSFDFNLQVRFPPFPKPAVPDHCSIKRATASSIFLPSLVRRRGGGTCSLQASRLSPAFLGDCHLENWTRRFALLATCVILHFYNGASSPRRELHRNCLLQVLCHCICPMFKHSEKV